MTLISRKKRPLNRTIPHLRDSRIFVIATEGSETEKQYFESFNNSRIQVKVIPTRDGHSAPKHVFERLNEYRNTYQIGKGDELWLVIDVDKWPTQTLGEIAAECIRRKYFLGVSNPCFEIWLYLHYSDSLVGLTDCGSLKLVLKGLAPNGYNPSNLRPERFHKSINLAITRAKNLHSNSGERWPTDKGTHIYMLVEKLQKIN